MAFPPRCILVGIDFSEPSRVALTMAARLAVHAHASLHVLHAEDPLLCAAARARGIDFSRELREEMETFVGATGLPPLDVHRHIVPGPAAKVICDIARRESADVIAVGARGMSGAERLIFGSTTEGVLRRAASSVLVVPDTWTPATDAVDLMGTGPVVSAIDFTGPALDAARAACRLALLLQTSVEFVHVVPDLPVPGRWRAHAEDSVRQRLQHADAELANVARACAFGAVIERRVERGSVATAIAEAARPTSVRHPILVLGRRLPGERGGAPGSTAYRVLTLARVPVLMYLPGN